MTVLGVDIGGTKVAVGRVNEHAEITGSDVFPTRVNEGFEVAIRQVWSAIDAALTPEVTAIGVCAPGPLDPRSGIIFNPPNLPGWRDVPLRQMVEDRYRLPARVENDCNAAGLAEARFGAARGCSTVFYAAIGTGIGSGIILDGRIHYGRTGSVGEGGHVTIDYRSPAICGCGTPGCIETLASGTAVARDSLSPADLAERLGAWLGGIVSLLDPDIIVIGGGVAQMGEPLFERLRAIVPQRTVNPHAASLPIVPAHFGQEAGVVGAAAVAMAWQMQSAIADAPAP
jgi:glucokinase